MVPVSSHAIANALQEALGLPREITFLQITLAMNTVVEVSCRYYPDEAALRHVETVLQHYHIVPRDEDTAEEELR
jgi:hypothetical protein